MNTRRSHASSHNRLAGSKWLSLTLVTLLSAPSAAFAAPGTVSPPKFGAYAVNVPLAPVASVIEVNKTGDGSNVNPNAGCDVDAATPGEQCTLRAAIQRAEVLAGDDTITFNIPTTEPDCVVASGACTINLTDGLQVSTNIAFVGPGADKLTVRRSTSGNYRVFLVLSTGTVSFSGLTISNGNTTSAGGGILHASTGSVNVADCMVSENRASSGGGGIANSSTGTVNITNSIIGVNFASRGAGILVNSGRVNVTNSIIGGNSTGGILNVSGTMNISNSTIAGNTGGGLVADVNGTTTVKSTIIVQNVDPAGAGVSGSFTSEGFNLIGSTDGSEGFTQPTDQTGTLFEPLDAKLTNVEIFGFPVLAQPRCDSPALDKGSSAGLNGTPTTDVRGAGFPRNIDDPDLPNAAGGDGTDIGAFERAVCSHNQFMFTVNKTGDADDLNPGDLICDSDAGATGPQCTLRAAIEEANVVQNDPNQSVTRTINFAIPMTEPDCDAAMGACIVNLTKALPEVSASVSIEGPGVNQLTVRRNSLAAFRIFTISSLPEVVTISGLTVSNGFTTDNGGGIAFFSDSSKSRVLNVAGCKVSDNHAGGSGGGIAAVNIGRAALNVTNSTISNNFTDAVPTGSSMVGGGGIAFTGNFGTLSITNSTISDNMTTGDGGGLYTAVLKKVSITNSQFIGNQAEQINARGGGILSIFGRLDMSNSQLTNNRARIGGGISVGRGSSEPFVVEIANITNSTFSSNTSSQNRGGGINLNRGTLNLMNSTISNNRGNPSTPGSPQIHVEPELVSPSRTLNVTNSTIISNDDGISGGAINILRDTLNVSNSTVIGGVAVGPTSAFGTWTVKSSIISRASSGAFTSGGFNLIGDPGHPSSSTGFTNGVNNDQVGTTAAPLDPKLDPAGLQNNGGPTQTIALQPDSPAIDKGTSAGLTGALATDQRGTGFPRTFDDPAVTNATGGDGTDIGAFERQAPPPVTTGNVLLINESCPPTNGAIDPGERVTVNLELMNTSNAATSSLVATLQTSGGVLAPSGPQSYGAIAVNSSAARDFSFTVPGNVSSGQTITATLQLQDGANSLGTVSFNFTAGPAPCSFVRLVMSSSLSRADASTVVGTITVQNIGSLPANDVTLNTAKLGTTTGMPLPQSLGTLAPGAFASVTVNFNNSTPGSSSVLSVGGTYTGGTFSSNKRITIP